MMPANVHLNERNLCVYVGKLEPNRWKLDEKLGYVALKKVKDGDLH